MNLPMTESNSKPEAEEEKPPTEKPRQRYKFECTRCGECCASKKEVQVTFGDLTRWIQKGTINAILPHLRMEIKDQIPFLVLKQRDNGEKCPLYDSENKACNIYHSMPCSCRSFPLGFNGTKYFLVDRSCPGIGKGVMSKEQLEQDRESARMHFEETAQTLTILPIIHILTIMRLQKEQQEEMENLSEEQRQQLEEILGTPKEEEKSPISENEKEEGRD